MWPALSRLIPLLFAGLLVTAAVAKVIGAVQTSIRSDLGAVFPWLELSVAMGELLLAVWLTTGIWPLGCWAAALLCSGAFSIASLTKLWQGSASCGCFGPVKVYPGWTLAVDLTIFGAFLLCGSPVKVGCRARTWFLGAVRWLAVPFSAATVVAGVVALVAITRFGSLHAAVAYCQGYVLASPTATQDLGDLAPGESVNAAFAVTNLLDRPVTVVGVKTSCACLTVNDQPMSISPGATANLLFWLRMPDEVETGAILKQSALLYLDVESAPVVLSMSATVARHAASSE